MIWFEIAAVLCIGVFPFLLSALSPLWIDDFKPQAPTKGIPYIIFTMAQGLLMIVPIAWIMVRSGVSAQRFGIQHWRWRIDPAIVLMTLVAYYVSIRIGELLFLGLYSLFPTVTSIFTLVPTVPGAELQTLPTPKDSWEWPIAIISLVSFALIEELVCRSYLINRLRDVGIPAFAAVLLSGLLFASYHLYEGVYAAYCIFFVGVAMGGLFLLTRRIIPIVIGHSLVNTLIALLYIYSSANQPR